LTLRQDITCFGNELGLLKTRQAERSGEQVLCGHVVQLSANPAPLFILKSQKAERQLHQVVFHLTSLDKGQVTQPWQGEGVLLDNGHQKLEPFVLTAGRRPRYSVCEVEGLQVVPRPGFDRVAVVWPNAPQSPVAADSTAESPA